MNNLHRELAPISDAAWADIEEETTRTLRYLAGRRVVDVHGPGGVGLLPETCTTPSSWERPRIIGIDDLAVAKPARFVRCPAHPW